MKPVSLKTLAGGTVVERFNYELRKLVENIVDPNTPADKLRKITLEVKVKPDKNREFGPAEIIIKSTLAPLTGIGTNLYFGTEQNKAVAYEHNPDQTSFPEMSPDNIGDREKIENISKYKIK